MPVSGGPWPCDNQAPKIQVGRLWASGKYLFCGQLWLVLLNDMPHPFVLLCATWQINIADIAATAS